ncbi:murein DD-endopeptidase MepM [Candidatus Hoaglandella endobia]|uniref:Murein DD-endopeptidase MepM n=1 Tax=Candidatus Hoaglandella endobia TaxID=1778263 RepID=A0A143WT84_9ENTR|nr:murein DD-endopeptidase MepM [Candidatus Hoaglandella endobia]CUX97051.1 Murein DD-endopeptidase MepM [Candidatus Hoaglandella endobia]
MQLIASTFALAFNHLPRSQFFILGSLTIVVTLAVAFWRPYVCATVVAPPANSVIPLEDYHLSKLIAETNKNLEKPPDIDADLTKNKLNELIAGEAAGVHEYLVSTGDTLISLLTQDGIGIDDITVLAQSYPTLRNLKIGQSLSWRKTADGDLQRLTWNISSRETRTYDRIEDGFQESITNLTGEWRNTIFTGKINGSFVTSARAAGLTRSDVNTVIKALQWQLDFRKLRKGDQFVVLASRETLNNKKNTQSQLLGVRLRTGSKDYYAFRADDGKFYNRDASGLVSGFMRFPTMKRFRVSSNFNPRRLNPITGRITPHRGVDFAVPVGTPVLAVGDGGVLVSKRDIAAGNYVAIRHGCQYMTRYMHLKKLLVKQGQKVKRGDRIALSGNTGRSSGPHLHFEVWINQQAVNPLTTKLPRTEELTGSDRMEYIAQVKKILPQLQLN